MNDVKTQREITLDTMGSFQKKNTTIMSNRDRSGNIIFTDKPRAPVYVKIKTPA